MQLNYLHPEVGKKIKQEKNCQRSNTLISIVIQSCSSAIKFNCCLLFRLLTDFLKKTFELILSELPSKLPSSSHLDQHVLNHSSFFRLSNTNCIHWKQDKFWLEFREWKLNGWHNYSELEQIDWELVKGCCSSCQLLVASVPLLSVHSVK